MGHFFTGNHTQKKSSGQPSVWSTQKECKENHSREGFRGLGRVIRKGSNNKPGGQGKVLYNLYFVRVGGIIFRKSQFRIHSFMKNRFSLLQRQNGFLLPTVILAPCTFRTPRIAKVRIKGITFDNK